GRLLRTLGPTEGGPDAPSEGIRVAIGLAVDPDGRRVACGYQPADIVKMWDVETGHVLWTTPGGGGANNLVAFSPDGRFLAVRRLLGSGVVTILAAPNGRILTSVSGGSPIFLGDQPRLATSLGDVKVWDTSDGQLLVSLRASGATYMGASPDG